MHCNLRRPDAAPLPIRFNFVARAKFEVAQPIRCHLRVLRYAVTLTFDLEHLWYTGCTAVKLCAKFEHNRAICGGVIAI